jgi:hypothetical protein
VYYLDTNEYDKNIAIVGFFCKPKLVRIPLELYLDNQGKKDLNLNPYKSCNYFRVIVYLVEDQKDILS